MKKGRPARPYVWHTINSFIVSFSRDFLHTRRSRWKPAAATGGWWVRRKIKARLNDTLANSQPIAILVACRSEFVTTYSLWRTHSCVPRRDFLDAWARHR